MNGSFSPPSRPQLPVFPEMPEVTNLNTEEACLMVAHYRGDLNLATRSSIAGEVFERFGVALVGGDSKFLNSLVRGLPPPSSNDVPLNRVQVGNVALDVVKHQSSQKLHDRLKQHKSTWVPSALPDRSPNPIVVWTEHWERYALNKCPPADFCWPPRRRAVRQLPRLIAADRVVWAHQESDEIFDKGC